MKNLRILLVGLLLILALVAFAQEMPVDENGLNSEDEYMKKLENSFYGILRSDGTEVLSCKYDSMLDLINDMVLTINLKSYKFGAMDLNGNVILKTDSDFPPIFVNGVAMVTKDGKTGVIDTSGNTVIPFEYKLSVDPNNILCLRYGVAILNKDNKYGVCDTRGGIIIPFEYEKIDVGAVFNNNNLEKMLRVKENGKIGYANFNGTIIVPPKYDEGSFYRNGVATVKINGKYTVIDVKGNELFEATDKYENMCAINTNLVAVMNKDKIGFLSGEGKEISSCVFTLFNTDSDKYKDILLGFSNGHKTLKEQQDYILDMLIKKTRPLIRLYKDNKVCFINKSGDFVFESDAYDVDNFVEDRAIFTVIDSFEINLDLLYNTKGRNIRFSNAREAYDYVKDIPQSDIDSMLEKNKGSIEVDEPRRCMYSYGSDEDFPLKRYFINIFSNRFGLNIDNKDKSRFSLIKVIIKQGVYSLAGKIVIPPVYDFITDFKDGYAIASLGENKDGLIDKNGNVVGCMIYSYVRRFHDDRALVRIDYKYGFIDKDGKVVIPIVYDNANDFVNGKAQVDLFPVDGNSPSNYCKIIDKDNNIIVDIDNVYLNIELCSDGIIIGTTREGKCLIGDKGQRISPFYSNMLDVNGSISDDDYEMVYGQPRSKEGYVTVTEEF